MLTSIRKAYRKAKIIRDCHFFLLNISANTEKNILREKKYKKAERLVSKIEELLYETVFGEKRIDYKSY
ncbi:MAG: hypothetical protein V4504_00825 [Patescibacteria group bacterium]